MPPDRSNVRALPIKQVEAFLAGPGRLKPLERHNQARARGRVLGERVRFVQRTPAIKDLTFDIDGLAISKANTKVEDTPVRMVIMGDAYLQREKTDKPNRFVCLIGEKGKVLLTFFTEQ
jgi:hypothetical protein